MRVSASASYFFACLRRLSSTPLASEPASANRRMVSFRCSRSKSRPIRRRLCRRQEDLHQQDGRRNDARAPQNDPSLPGPSFARLSFVAVRSYWLLDLTGQIRRASLALHRAEIGRHHRRLAPSGSRPFLPFAALSFHLPAFLEGEYSFQCLDRRASTDGLAYCGEVSFHSPRSGSSTTLIVCAVATS